MSALIENNWVLIFASVLWLRHILVQVYKESLASQRHVIGKWKSILRYFSDHGEYSLILQQNLISSYFLKVSCNEKSENISLNFLYGITLQLICSTLYLDLSLMHDFAASWIGDLENTGLLSCVDLLNIGTFHHSI